ncbi:ankyrin repeat-containing protein [Colletotrichum musicola]|uniref:Ankyrin repeat-containing protein n=1 Tax=Colletotrichum musicola TaxID=2175873 RepID=A0A8H6JCG2_9PEZI|nr:ankyrin repeat-containing protein [Colletotrichum musicola]
MAEVFGVVASAVARRQAVESVMKLKQLWDKIQDAPKRFSDLFVKLEILSALLDDVDRQFADPDLPPGFWDRNLAQQSLKLCRNVSSQLEVLCSSLKDQLSSTRRPKRFKGAIKVIMNDDGVRELEAKLDSALSLLQMAHQCYLGALTQALPAIIGLRMSALGSQSAPAEKDESNFVAERQCMVKQVSQSRKRTNPHRESSQVHNRRFSIWGWMTIETLENGSNYTSSVKIRDWLTQKIWEAQSTTGWGGWQFNMRVHSTIPLNGSAMQCIRKDDAEGLLKLFNDRAASPYDRNTRDWTLLFTATVFASYKVSKLLLELGAEVEEIYPSSEHPDSQWIPFPSALRSQLTSSMVDLWADFGLDSSCFSPTCKSPYDILYRTRASDNALKALQRRLCPEYFTIDFSRRCQVARLAVCVLPRLRYPATLAYLIRGADRLSPNDLSESAAEDVSLLITATTALGLFSAYHALPVVDNNEYLIMPEDAFEAWREFLIDLLSLGCQVEVVNPRVYFNDMHPWRVNIQVAVTPLRSVMQGVTEMIPWAARNSVKAAEVVEVFRVSLYEWLKIVHSAGVDLIRYGLWEQRQRCSHNLMDTFDNLNWDTPQLQFVVHLVGFRIGSLPDEWSFWLVEEHKRYALDFWQMLDKRVEVMPGSWVD